MPGRPSAKVPWDRWDDLVGSVPDKTLARIIVREEPGVASLSWSAVRKRRLLLGRPPARQMVREAQRESQRLRSWKVAASRLGLTLEQYTAKRRSGQMWCHRCDGWHPRGAFEYDDSTRARIQFCRRWQGWNRDKESDRGPTSPKLLRQQAQVGPTPEAAAAVP